MLGEISLRPCCEQGRADSVGNAGRRNAAYGVAVYFFMNLVVIPLSAIGAVRFSPVLFANGILIHVFGVGIPSALFARSIRRST